MGRENDIHKGTRKGELSHPLLWCRSKYKLGASRVQYLKYPKWKEDDINDGGIHPPPPLQ